MKKIIFGSIVASLAGVAAWAGGLADAIVETVPEAMPVETTDSSTGWIIPLLIVGALVAVAVASSDDDDDEYTG